MIKYENNMLVLDHTFTKQDEQAINEFVRKVKKDEQERIIRLLDTSRMCTCKDTCKTDINVYAFVREELNTDLMGLIRGE
jgi:energy-coupling factor transporter ATP-binding protein EcfA2